MTVRRFAIACLALLPIAAAACSSTSEQVSDKIAEKAQTELKLDETPTVTCPDGAEAKKGEKFTCTIALEKVKLPIKVTFTDDSTFDSTVEGAVYRKPVLLKALTEKIEEQIGDSSITVKSIDCPGSKLVVFLKDTVIDCPAEDSGGNKATVKVGLDDNLEATIQDVIAE